MTRRIDAAEALTNAVLGLVVSVGITYAALPLWGLTPSLGDSLGITAMYFIVSTARAYLIRRIFRGLA